MLCDHFDTGVKSVLFKLLVGFVALNIILGRGAEHGAQRLHYLASLDCLVRRMHKAELNSAGGFYYNFIACGIALVFGREKVHLAGVLEFYTDDLNIVIWRILYGIFVFCRFIILSHNIFPLLFSELSARKSEHDSRSRSIHIAYAPFCVIDRVIKAQELFHFNA